LILTDIHMPEAKGTDICRTLKNEYGTQDIPIVLFSSLPDEELTKLADQVGAEVRRHFGDAVFETVIPRSVRLSEAPSFGRPIIRYDPAARAAKAYRSLAQEVLARWSARSRGSRGKEPA
jgi:cellulose biosynthesis protein BcsQ